MRKTLKKKIKIFRSFSHFFPLIFETSNGYMFQTEKNYKIWSSFRLRTEEKMESGHQAA
jgi:hypothetical protein